MKEQIQAYFDRHLPEMIEDVKTLVRIRSDRGDAQPDMPFGPGPRAALEKAMELGTARGFKVKNWDNYVCTIDLPGEPGLDMLAHLDVVPVANNWTVCDPFEPVVQDGKIYGRGTADDKGPAVAALWAMQCVRDLGVPLKHRVRLLLGTDEECGSGDIAHYYATEPEAPMTFSPDADFPLINTEKGMFRGSVSAKWDGESGARVLSADAGFKINVVPDTADAVVAGVSLADMQAACEKTAEKTGLQYTAQAQDGAIAIHVVGVGAHAAEPEKGNNALTGLFALLSALPLDNCASTRAARAMAKLFPHGDWFGRALGVAMEDEISGPLTLSLNMLHWDAQGFEAVFDSRTAVCATEENMKQVAMRACAAEGLTLADDPMSPPHHVSADSDFVRTLLACYTKYTGLPGEAMSIGGGTYVHHLKNGVAYGCAMLGVENNMHGANEFMRVEDLKLSAEIFAQAIIDLCGK